MSGVADFRSYDVELAASDSRAQPSEAARQFKASLERLQQRLQARLTGVDTGEGCDSAASEHEHEPTITPATFSRRLLLSTDQPLNVPEIMLLNRLYYAESKVLQTSHDLIVWSMLNGVDSGDGDILSMRELPQLLNAFHKEVRR